VAKAKSAGGKFAPLCLEESLFCSPLEDVVSNSREFCEIMGQTISPTIYEISEAKKEGTFEELFGTADEESIVPCYDGIPSAKKYGDL
jgi:hypothetical protein